MIAPAPRQWQRTGSRQFVFGSRTLNPASGEVCLGYELDGIQLHERIVLPVTGMEAPESRRGALDAALDLLHWTAGVSYWKAGCPPEVRFAARGPDRWQADWLTRLYRQGLAEFAWCNNLDPDRWSDFPFSGSRTATAVDTGLARRTLVPMGGGKDSLVAWSRLRRMGETTATVQIGRSELIAGIGKELGDHHWQIARQLDPRLAELNRLGAWNGHVPVTAINSAILVLACLVLDYDRVAFANERSADEASRLDSHGRPVNHQFSKSFEFELMLDQWIRRYIEPNLRVYSLLRRERELAICREFAELKPLHGLFSSCNRNFHLDGPRTGRWCGQCPKCHFVFLALAPFMSPPELIGVFGKDLLAAPDQLDGFAALLALDGNKPFECVGEADEARAAIVALATDPAWAGHEVVICLSERLRGIAVPTLAELCRPVGPHRIPPELLDAA